MSKKEVYTELFKEADKDCSGTVTPGELKRVVQKKFGHELSIEDLHVMFIIIHTHSYIYI